jgi:predicted ATP-dependent endonuclease of OLD family
MAIKRIEIKDFLVFRGEFAVDFNPGVNVLIGENGTGKTTLLKIMYAIYENVGDNVFEECGYPCDGEDIEDDIDLGSYFPNENRIVKKLIFRHFGSKQQIENLDPAEMIFLTLTVKKMKA